MSRSTQLPLLLPSLLLLAGLGRATAAPAPDAPADASANRLVDESSPYLRLHAHNPVDWYPWGEEALERARREDKPIFLSVGYSTCYWCHVMEREAFSDPEIAALMNGWFVNVKVDREERPDLDEIYMTATQMLTGSGGWPNSVFLTPELAPFYAGTYFPPEDRHGRPGFPSVLRAIHRAWEERRGEVEARAARVAEAINGYLAGAPAGAVPGPEAAAEVAAQLARRYDREHGGFGRGHKFPSPANLWLLWESATAGDAEAREMVLHTLRRMGRGAIYDQLDGGFHRYTLDAAWRIPHFEKMLYDNAHLAELLAVTAAAEGDDELARLARGTADFVLRWMRLANGAFKSAIDAETDAVEGAYYVWSRAELEQTLGEEGFGLLAPIYGFDGPPNFEGERYTLYLTDSLAAHAARLELTTGQLLGRLGPGLDRLRSARARRKFPLVDDKVLTDWNGMMIAALARAGGLLAEPRYVAAAARAAEFVLEMRDAGGVQLHVWRQGQARIPAFLDDYAYLVRGLLALHEATGERRWLTAAQRLAEEQERRLGDPRGGYFFSQPGADLLVRIKSAGDGAIPSGNGVALLNLLELTRRTGRADYRRRAEAGLRAFAAELERSPGALTTVALAVTRFAGGSGGPTPSAAAAGERVAAAGQPDAVATGQGVSGEGAAGEGAAGLPSPHRLAQEVVTSELRLAAGGDWRPFELALQIRDGWHVNANPASLDYLIPTRVDGAVQEVVYPPGAGFRFAFADEELSVYTGRAAIRGALAAGSTALELTYQACDDRRCLPPVTRTVEAAPGPE